MHLSRNQRANLGLKVSHFDETFSENPKNPKKWRSLRRIRDAAYALRRDAAYALSRDVVRKLYDAELRKRCDVVHSLLPHRVTVLVYATVFTRVTAASNRLTPERLWVTAPTELFSS